MSKAEGFAAVPNWMIRDRSISRSAVIVYASLASRSGLGGIHPSQSTIAEEAGLSERTVRSMLTELEALGVIQRVRRSSGARGRGNRLPDGYTLHPNGHVDHAADVAVRSELPATNAMQPAKNGDATGNEQHVTPLIGRTREVEPVEVEPRKRGTRIPEPFILTADMKAWAATEVPGLDVIAHTREFVDHWRAASGQTAVKRDWVAAWRNWMRKAHRWDAPKQSRPAPRDRMLGALDAGARVQEAIERGELAG